MDTDRKVKEFCSRPKFGADALDQIELINKHHGSKWKLGDSMVIRSGGLIVEALLVGAEKGCFRVMMDDDDRPHSSIFKPERCTHTTL